MMKNMPNPLCLSDHACQLSLFHLHAVIILYIATVILTVLICIVFTLFAL